MHDMLNERMIHREYDVERIAEDVKSLHTFSTVRLTEFIAQSSNYSKNSIYMAFCAVLELLRRSGSGFLVSNTQSYQDMLANEAVHIQATEQTSDGTMVENTLLSLTLQDTLQGAHDTTLETLGSEDRSLGGLNRMHVHHRVSMMDTAETLYADEIATRTSEYNDLLVGCSMLEHHKPYVDFLGLLSDLIIHKMFPIHYDLAKQAVRKIFKQKTSWNTLSPLDAVKIYCNSHGILHNHYMAAHEYYVNMLETLQEDILTVNTAWIEVIFVSQFFDAVRLSEQKYADMPAEWSYPMVIEQFPSADNFVYSLKNIEQLTIQSYEKL